MVMSNALALERRFGTTNYLANCVYAGVVLSGLPHWLLSAFLPDCPGMVILKHCLIV